MNAQMNTQIKTQMKTHVVNTVNTLLQRSGQSFPVNNLSRGKNSVQVYDVKHWPDIFNVLLLHAFPSISISVGASVASRFVVTLRWHPDTVFKPPAPPLPHNRWILNPHNWSIWQNACVIQLACMRIVYEQVIARPLVAFVLFNHSFYTPLIS